MFNLGFFLSFSSFLFLVAVNAKKTCSTCSELQRQPSFAFHISRVYEGMALCCSTSRPKLCDDVPISLGSSPGTGILSSEVAFASSSSTWSWGVPGPGSSVSTGLL